MTTSGLSRPDQHWQRGGAPRLAALLAAIGLVVAVGRGTGARGMPAEGASSAVGASARASVPAAAEEGPRRLARADYEDRVRAIWTGQVIAVLLGWPFEHKPAAVRDIDAFDAETANRLARDGAAPVDDDWYYEMIALGGFERHGIGMTAAQLGEEWRIHDVGTWGSAYYTRQALERGVSGEDSGHPRHNRMWFTVGNQNRADFYGAISPGMPWVAADLARRLGRVNSHAEGIDGGVLVGAMVSLAFVERDVRNVIRRAVPYLDPGSPHRTCVEEIVRRAEAGEDAGSITRYVEERWAIAYPATNSAVWNAGLAVVALWFGEGDFWRSINLALQASDYADADCLAANVAVVIAAMRGTQALPPDLVAQLGGRIRGDMLGFAQVKPPVDETFDRLTARTVAVAETLVAARGGKVTADAIVPRPSPGDDRAAAAPAPPFHPNDFVQWWNPGWRLDRAGFGAPGGGVRGVRGGTFLDGDVLVTYPRDEVRGVRLSRTLRLGAAPRLVVDVAADPGRTWRLDVYVDHARVHTRLVEGGPALDWPDVAPEGYPQPLHEYERSARERRWQTVTLDLAAFANREVVVRLYQGILVRNAFPGNAYWRGLKVE